MRKKNRWRILVLSDANGKIKQFSLHKIVFYGFLFILFTSLISLFITIKVIENMSEENVTLKKDLEMKESVVAIQKQKLVEYDQASREVQHQLEELSLLEAQLNEMISSLNPNRIVSFEEDGPQGGIEWSVENNQLNDEDPQNLVQLKYEVPTLIEKYKVALDELELLKDELRSIPIYWPADTERITSQFGNRVDPFTKRQAFHNGIDLAGPWGTEIYATGDGVVEFSGYDGGYGRSIIINHGNSYKTRYAHLTNLLVEEGDKVKQGDLIGLMGSTGRSTGVHLHYEIIHNGEVIDPFPYMTFLQRVLGE